MSFDCMSAPMTRQGIHNRHEFGNERLKWVPTN